MTHEKTLEDLHREMLHLLFEGYRMMKADPAQQERIEFMMANVRSIGAIYAAQGFAAVHAFLDKFADAYGDDAETWLWRRWDGLRLPDGSVWCS